MDSMVRLNTGLRGRAWFWGFYALWFIKRLFEASHG